MKKIFKSVIFLFFAGMMSVNAQVNIGTDQDPSPGALLQLRNDKTATGDAANASKGLALPRVLLSEVDKLYPMFLKDPTLSATDENIKDAYKGDDKKAAVDKEHTGLVVYNLTDDPGKELVPGLSVWNGSRWMSLTTSTVDNGNNGNKEPTAFSLISIKVNGTYKKNKTLETENTIEMKVDITGPGNYTVATQETSGISFYKTDFFSGAGTHTIIIQGEGMPTTDTSIPLTLYLQLPDIGTAVFDITVPITKPEVTYAIIGNNPIDPLHYGYLWDSEARTAALTSKANFGPEGKVKVNNFQRLWTLPRSDAATELTSAMQSKQNIPDIILYNTYSISATAGKDLNNYLTPELEKALAQYVSERGCLIFGASNDDEPLGTTMNNKGTKNRHYTSTLLKDIFGKDFGLKPLPNTGSSWSPGFLELSVVRLDDNYFQIANNESDTIINGPFGNLAKLNWGSDNGANMAISNLPNKDIVQICSAKNQGDYRDQDESSSIVWYAKNFNFFFFGDVAGSTTNPDHLFKEVEVPALYSTEGVPQSKYYGTLLDKAYIYNAQLEMNAVAWAIHRALTNGINMNKRNSGN